MGTLRCYTAQFYPNYLHRCNDVACVKPQWDLYLLNQVLDLDLLNQVHIIPCWTIRSGKGYRTPLTNPMPLPGPVYPPLACHHPAPILFSHPHPPSSGPLLPNTKCTISGVHWYQQDNAGLHGATNWHIVTTAAPHKKSMFSASAEGEKKGMP